MSNLVPRNLFDQFEKFVKDPIAQFRGYETTNMLNIDIKDEGDVYSISADLPGVEKEDINLTMEDDMLNISVEQKKETDEEKDEGKYIRRERFYSSASRSISLPLAIQDGEIHASLANGVLSITVPKIDDKTNNAKQIEIK